MLFHNAPLRTVRSCYLEPGAFELTLFGAMRIVWEALVRRLSGQRDAFRAGTRKDVDASTSAVGPWRR